MATLVLTAVGTAIAGPLGGLLGAAAGQAVDARWLGPAGRRGPRLSDLRVQLSSYGTVIPRLYGRMRVAGTVIWSTDLIEQRQRRRAGKGQPATTTYSYSVSLAVALSSRPIVGVRRIWADGNLLRGQDGSFVEPTIFRVHQGSEDQPVDPLIAAAEGAEAAPAYRGIAYAVFEQFDLSPFGNRVPSLAFEVEADSGPVSLSLPVGDALRAPLGTMLPPIEGYALMGATRREAVQPVAALLRLSAEADGGWRMAGADAAATLPEPAHASPPVWPERRMGAADRLPRAISLASYDPARDYQLAVHTATVPGGRGSAASIDLPMAAAASAARQIAEQEATRQRAAQRAITWPAGLAGLALRPGALVLADGQRQLVTERRIAGGAAIMELIDAGGLAATVAADGGRAVTSPDAPSGDTLAALIDLPALTPNDVDQVRLVLAATGTGAGWRRARVSLVPAAGAAAIDIGVVQAATVFGTVVTIAGDGGTTHMFDDVSTVEVALGRPDMQLANADDADLLAGANLAMAGDELFQFGLAEPLGSGRWRLRRLLRGRRGSGSAAPGAPFVLLDDPALMLIGDAGTSPEVGGDVQLAATGTAAPVLLPIVAAGRAQRPLAPVHLAARWQTNGALDLHWVRRSRTGFDWRDGVDAPLDAGSELYRLTLRAGVEEDVITCTTPHCAIDAATVAGWRDAATTDVTVEVQQVGTLAMSAPATVTVPIA